MTDNTAKLDEIFTGVKAAQDKIDSLEKKHQALDGLDVAQVKRISDDVTANMAAIQEAKQAQKGLEESMRHMEASLLKSAGSVKSDEDAHRLYGQQFARFMRKGTAIDESVTKDMVNTLVTKSFYGADQDHIDHEIKTMSVQNNPDGGYLLRPQYSAIMIKRNFETSPIRNVASIQTTGTDSLEFIIDDNTGVSGGWVTEQAARSVTATTQVGKLVISVHEQYASPQVTQKLLDDAAVDVESFIANKIQDIFTRTENTAFVTGTGVGQPRGLTVPSAWASAGVYERNKLEQVKTGNATLLTADGIKNLQNSLLEIYQPSAVFLMQRATFAAVVTLKDGQGRYLLDPNSFKAGDDKMLLGKAVWFASDFASVGASALPIAYGDFGIGYTILDRLGIRVIRDNFTSKPYTIFYTTKRVGGDVTNYESIKLQLVSA